MRRHDVKSKKSKTKPKKDAVEVEQYPELIFNMKKSDKGRIQVSVRKYGNGEYLDIRHMYLSGEGDWRPTPKGCAIPLTLAEKLHRRLGKLIKKAQAEEGLKTSED